jgi:hypothetical protein
MQGKIPISFLRVSSGTVTWVLNEYLYTNDNSPLGQTDHLAEIRYGHSVGVGLYECWILQMQRDFLTYSNDYQLLKKHSAPYIVSSYFITLCEKKHTPLCYFIINFCEMFYGIILKVPLLIQDNFYLMKKKLQKLKITTLLIRYWITKLSFTKEFNASVTINLNLLIENPNEEKQRELQTS